MPDPNDYPVVVTLRFADKDHAETVLHDIEYEFQTVEWNENERGQNIYYVTQVPGT